jgi:hypothetical protein
MSTWEIDGTKWKSCFVKSKFPEKKKEEVKKLIEIL